MQNEKKAEIEREIENIKNKYLNSANEIVGDYNRENLTIREYEGRQLYELLQNADDEAVNSEGKVRLSFKENILTIYNTGTPFSVAGIKSLMYSNSSPKLINVKKIGRKGLGFRSVLSWAKRVTVATEDFTVQFSKDHAIEIYKSIIEEKPELKDNIHALNSDEYPIAVLPCPELTAEIKAERGFATSIIIECHPELAKTIEDKIKKLEFEELIFLPNTKEVEIICGENYHKRFFKADYKDDKQVLIEAEDLIANMTDSSNWFVFKTSGTVEDDKNNKSSDYEFIIAFDPTGKHSGDVLYSYFKTDVKLKFPALIHGTFELTGNRNHLMKDGINSKLIPLLSDFMVQTAVEISKNQEECNYQPLKLIVSSEMDSILSDYYKLGSLLREKAKKQSIFPMVSGKYTSLEDKPFYSEYDFASVLPSDDFPFLMKYCDDKDIQNFIRECGISFYEYKHFCSLINNNIQKYTMENKVRLISMIIKQYSDVKDSGIFPHLLEDTDRSAIESPFKVYPVPSDEQIIEVPDWVNIRFLSKEMEEELNKTLTIKDKRELSRRLSRFNLEEYSFDKVLSGVINQTADQIETKEKCIDILSWLWGYYKLPDRKPLTDLKIKVITCDGNICFARECYLGSEFGNQIGENIVSIYSKYFLSKNYISEICKCNDNDILINFAEWLGVSKFPRFIKKELRGTEKENYIKSCYPLYVQSDNRNYYEDDFTISNINSLTVGCYEYFDEILEKASINDILAWLVIDQNAKRHFCAKNESENSEALMKGTPKYKQGERIVSKYSMTGYIKWLLLRKEWIPDKNGLKKNPEYCCFEDNGLSPLVIVPDIDYSAINKYVGRPCKRDVDAILGNIGIEENFSEMLPSVIYEVLLALPELDQECRKGKSLYRKIIKEIENKDSLIKNNANYSKYVEEGQILVKQNEERKYVSVKKAYYTNNKVFSREILKTFCIAEIDSRQGEDNVNKLFGVKPLKELDLTVESVEKHPLNEQFHKEYRSFLPFVYACRMEQKNSKKDLNNLQSTTVILCKAIKIKYKLEAEEREGGLLNYETIYLPKDHIAYILVSSDITDFQKLKSCYDFGDAVAEVITAILSVDEDKGFYCRLFRDNMRDREQSMRSEKCDDNLARLSKAREIFDIELNSRDEFWKTIAEIKKCSVGDDKENTADKIISALKLPADIDSGINFNSINDISNCDTIVNIFKMLESDISVFNDISPIHIKLIGYWKKMLKEKAAKYKKKYQANLFNDLADDSQNAEEYYSFCSDYDYTEYDGISNSVYVDIDKIFEKQFGVSFEYLDKFDDDYIGSILAEKKAQTNTEHLELLKQRFQTERIEAYLLFDCIGDLGKPQADMTEAETQEKGRSIIDSISKMNLPKMENIEISKTDKDETYRTTNENPDGKVRNNKHSAVHSNKTEQAKRENGQIGEFAAYLTLLNEQHQNVMWVSGNAQKMRPAVKGDDSLGYDIKYIDEQNQTQFVEVKSSERENITFEISDNELSFARDHADNYAIIYVVIGKDKENKKIPKHIWNLGHIFKMDDGEDLLNNDRFNIRTTNYEVTIKRKS